MIFWYVIMYAFTHMCDKIQPYMFDKTLGIGIFPQILVWALVIMMVRDDMLDHTPPLNSLRPSFKCTKQFFCDQTCLQWNWKMHWGLIHWFCMINDSPNHTEIVSLIDMEGTVSRAHFHCTWPKLVMGISRWIEPTTKGNIMSFPYKIHSAPLVHNGSFNEPACLGILGLIFQAIMYRWSLGMDK